MDPELKYGAALKLVASESPELFRDLERLRRAELAGQGKKGGNSTVVASGLNNPAKVFNVVGTAENTVANVGDIVYVYIKPELIALAVS
jgi:hypothetical protein